MSKKITFSVTEEEHNKIKNAAAAEGLTANQYSKRSTFINFKTAPDIRREEKEMYAKEAGISSSYDAASYLSDIKHAEKEHFVVLTLNTQNNIIRKHTIAIGTVNRCSVHQRDIFRAAVADNAVSIIIAHNHPAGSLIASDQDRELEKIINECGIIMGIKLLDSIIVSENGCSSAANEGRL